MASSGFHSVDWWDWCISGGYLRDGVLGGRVANWIGLVWRVGLLRWPTRVDGLFGEDCSGDRSWGHGGKGLATGGLGDTLPNSGVGSVVGSWA